MSTTAQSRFSAEYGDKAFPNYIGGEEYSAPSDIVFDVINPATGQAFAQVHGASAATVDKAVASARQTFNQGVWRTLRAADRARILWRFAELVERDQEKLAELDTLNNGMPLKFARMMVSLGAYSLRYYAGMCEQIAGKNASSAISSREAPFHAYTQKEPLGVAALIIPWNGPVASFLMKVAMALAAGCSCVVKPAENTPVSALLLARLALEAGIPAGVLNVVNGIGRTTGAALVEHDGIDKISFTGSTVTGKAIMRAAADRMKRITLELGGKSPAIIFDDADLAKAVPAAAMACFINSGQICIAGSRLYVQRSRIDEVIDKLRAFTDTLTVGDGFSEKTDLGPLISRPQFDKVCNFIELGSSEGGELIHGGARNGDQGFFVEPTVFLNDGRDLTILREEVFGPVLVVTPFDEEDEVIAMANDSRYGLAAGIFTENLSRAHRVAGSIQSGNIWVNCYGIADCPMPFGGFKESGVGREFSSEGVEAFMETKSVYMAL